MRQRRTLNPMADLTEYLADGLRGDGPSLQVTSPVLGTHIPGQVGL
jgi:hypothetical protein